MGQTADKKGTISVMAVLTQAYKQGLFCSWPLSNERYDLIIDNGKKMFRVQVKGTSIQDKRRWKISTTTYDNTNFTVYAQKYIKNKNRRRTKAYSENEIDFIIAHIIPLNIFYIVPVKELNGAKGFNVVPNNPKTKNRYEKFRENWSLLCQ